MCDAFIASNIPLNKLENAKLRGFSEKYTGRQIPKEVTLRKKYVQHAYEKCLREVKCKLQNEKIWVSIDESMDSVGCHVANVVESFIQRVKIVIDDKVVAQFLNYTYLESTNQTSSIPGKCELKLDDGGGGGGGGGSGVSGFMCNVTDDTWNTHEVAVTRQAPARASHYENKRKRSYKINKSKPTQEAISNKEACVHELHLKKLQPAVLLHYGVESLSTANFQT
ncbi:hypothetical protein ANN_23556 [Periplaneta americana]|uniref:Uncharacterized protein n=1 Tax=Periplaneta americana TaxID=6978 RepID=A0ABQ8SLE8_PERAM|nr:hypothetical protein ANN_23556 [Periplaneta americana]